MTERPILFSVPMVRAILAGQKTQTRRIVKRQFAHDAEVAEVANSTPEGFLTSGHSGLWWDDAAADIDSAIACPYGVPGDRLWVREAWHAAWDFNSTPPRDIPAGSSIEYAATARTYAEIGIVGKLRPGMFMPRWASRITLEITGVHVERLQAISEDDAMAEGVTRSTVDPDYFQVDGPAHLGLNARESFAHLWEAINGAGSVDANPWVWVVEFKREGV